jgi:cation diffusion facilitator CzcD-associated flavoprotein CzcO
MDNRTEIAIIGAGFAGMYLLHRLRGMGVPAQVLEAGSGVGGTWYWNRYPGARCDIESIQYSYQFDDALQQEWDWSERYATQPEILKYAEHVADRYDLRPDIRFNTRVRAASYDETVNEWTLEAEDGSTFTSRICVMATGCLSVPNKPNIKGLEDFSGPTYHTGEWPHENIDFTGQRVAVIGTGSSAIQSIPRIAAQAAHLTVFQRTANYSVPARNAPLDPEYVKSIKARYAEFRAEASMTGPGIHAVFNPDSVLDATPEEQFAAYEERWQQGGLIFMGAFGDAMLSEAANDVPANFVRKKIHDAVKDPSTAERLSPKNIIGAKRLCVDTGYYDTFNRDNVTLIDIKEQPLQEITANSVRVDGQEVDIDALVIATGFDAMTGAIMKVDIKGRNGARLQERWADGPSSYLGLAMADFPNLFTVTGPGSPSVFTNMLPTIEQHVDWIADCVGYMNAGNYRCIEATEAAEKEWWEHCQEVASVGLKSSTDSWYLGANVEGKPRVFMPYLGGYPEYCRRCDEIVAEGYRGFAFS